MDQDKVLERAAEQQRESAAARKLDAVFTCPSCGRASGTCALNCPRAQSGIGLTQHIFDTALAMNRAAALTANAAPICTLCREPWIQNVHTCNTRKVERLTAALDEIYDLFGDEMDVIDGEFGPQANRAMRVCQLIDSALGRKP